MDFKLPDSIGSPEQLQEVAMNLDDYIADCRSRAIKQRKGLDAATDQDNVLRQRLGDLAALLGPADKLDLEQAEQLRTWLTQLAREAPVVHLTLPDLAGASLKQQLVAWIRANLSPHSLVAFHHNRALAGGMVVRTANHIYDFSFRKRLLDQRAAIARIIKNV
ncbi:MAG TPA: hypothetical protein VK963_03190 [Candidatus Saccharimonadales bacterium]|nr:hypothetical protein [Candidatus Saccharimonadales bacterium]